MKTKKPQNTVTKENEAFYRKSLELLSDEEIRMIKLSFGVWNLQTLQETRQAFVKTQTITHIINSVIIHTWKMAKGFYENKAK